jgi:hypothetical protein
MPMHFSHQKFPVEKKKVGQQKHCQVKETMISEIRKYLGLAPFHTYN